MTVDIVIPTLGRASLPRLLASLAAARGPLPERLLLVDDRRDSTVPLLDERMPESLAGRLEVLAGRGRGPAAARNVGWRAGSGTWVAFLDDDVEVSRDWLALLAEDLGGLPAAVAGSQGRVRVPLGDRPATDWQRNVAGLETGVWLTADMAYRRTALLAAGGFDERFPRAYREDSDLGLRLVDAGWRIVRGSRSVSHPVPPADRWASVRLQRGNADDVLMRALHGPRWAERAGSPPGRRPRHLATAGAGLAAAAGLASGRQRVAVAGLAGWLALTAELAWSRIKPGPRTTTEVGTMLTSSAVLPFAAAWHWLLALARVARDRPRPLPTAGPPAAPPRAVLFDRDGTLVVDEPYNGDPARVRLLPGARAALDRVRAAGIPVAVVSNQSGVARGLLGAEQVVAVNRRVEELVGPVDGWFVCPHGPDHGCGCRKPAPGLVHAAAAALGVDPADCVLIGDIGSDMAAARAAGARAVLVPTPATRREEVAEADLVAADLHAAVDLLLAGSRPSSSASGRGEA